jgi:uncharacterized membrane protein YadS
VTASARTLRAPTHAAPEQPRDRHRAAPTALWPGLLLSALIAGAGFALRTLPGVATLSPMILAIVIGMVFHNLVGTPATA